MFNARNTPFLDINISISSCPKSWQDICCFKSLNRNHNHPMLLNGSLPIANHENLFFHPAYI
jgi:hypothetical protein